MRTTIPEEINRLTPKADPNPTRVAWSSERLASGRVSRIPPGYVTIAMIMERTGYSRSEINSLAHRNIIQSATRNNQGWMLYPESSVEAAINYKKKEPRPKERALKLLPACNRLNSTTTAYSTEEGLLVFRLLKNGVNPDDISLEAELHPSVVRTILRDYELLTGSIMIHRPIVDQINKLSLEGVVFPIEEEEAILKALKIASRERMCRSCKKKPRTDVCGRCAKIVVMRSISRNATVEAPTEVLIEESVENQTDTELSDQETNQGTLTSGSELLDQELE